MDYRWALTSWLVIAWSTGSAVANADDLCTLAAEIGDEALGVDVQVGESSFYLNIEHAKVTARLHDASEDGIPVEVESPLRFRAYAYRVASKVELGGGDGELHVGIGATLEIEAMRSVGNGEWRARIRFREGTLGDVAVRCDDLQMLARNVVPLKASSRTARRWSSTVKAVTFADEHGRRGVTVDFHAAHPDGHFGTFAEIQQQGTRILVECDLGSNVVVRGWIDRARLAESNYGGQIGLVEHHEWPTFPRVDVTLPAGTEVFAAATGPHWAVLTKGGVYHAEHVGDGLVNLVELPGIELASLGKNPRVFLVRAPEVGSLPDAYRARVTAPSAGGDPPVLDFGKGMDRPRRLSGRDPEFTEKALAEGVAGSVIVRCVIEIDGSLRQCRVIKSLPQMDDEVLAALATHTYTPVMYEGKPVRVRYTFNIKFVAPD